jgi:hypothetical protein
VLLAYYRLRADGRPDGRDALLREVIAQAEAKVVIVALPNSTEAYIAGARRREHFPVNLIMTLDRHGAAFGRFFARLFGLMAGGREITDAWTCLCDASVDEPEAASPDTIFANEIGPLFFGEVVPRLPA